MVTRLFGIGQVLRGEPEVQRVLGHQFQSEIRSDGRRASLQSDRIQFADERDVPHGILEVFRTEVEVIDAQRLLENRWVRAFRNGHHHRVGVSHVMAAHDVGTVGQSARVLVVGGAQEKCGRIDCSARHDNHIRRIVLKPSVAFHQLHSSPRGRMNLFPAASPENSSGA